MTTARWRRLEELLLQGLTLPDSERDAFLRDACRGDETMIADVRSLLREEDAARHFMETPAFAGVEDGLDRGLVDAELGPYRVLRRVATGGMGVVFEAVDRTIGRRVALKLVRDPAFAGPRAVRRFEREIHVLGRLSHPGIATIHGVGATADGLPYFAMEYVDGERIDRYVERAALGVRDVLSLMRDVCEAVDHAHRQGVVHLDLKPSNVLVCRDDGSQDEASSPPSTRRPRIKVLDFGIARVVGDGATHDATRTVIGTPAFMSPEHARGSRHVDRRSDVYSLGVLLFDLLVGRLPYDLDDASHEEALRIIATEAPLRPSGVRRELSGDPEAILQKALHKELELRYADAGELGDDIDRYLDARPILARPPGVVYQLTRWTSRHRLPALVAAGWIVAAIGGLVWATHVQARSREADRLAEQKLLIARQVHRYLDDLLSAPAGKDGDWSPPSSELIDRAAERLEAAALDPLVGSAIHSSVARAYDRLGRYERSEHHLRRSLDLLVESPVVPTEREQAIARQELAGALRHLGRLDEAEELYLAALGFERVGDSERAVIHSDYAGLLRLRDRDDDAEVHYQRAYDLLAQCGDDEHLLRVGVTNNLATLHLHRGEYGPAATMFREVGAALTEALGPEHPDVAIAWNNLGGTLRAAGDHTGAEVELRKAIAIRRAYYTDGHPHLASSLYSLARVNRALDRLDEAARLALEAIDMEQRFLPGHHKTAQRRIWLAAVELERDDPTAAIAQLVAAKEGCPAAGAKKTLVDIEEGLTRAYATLGDHRAAYDAASRWCELLAESGDAEALGEARRFREECDQRIPEFSP